MTSRRQSKKPSSNSSRVSYTSALSKPVIIPRKQYFVYYWEWGKWHDFGIDSVGIKYAEFVYPTREEAEQAIVDYCQEHPWRAHTWKIEETLVNPFWGNTETPK